MAKYTDVLRQNVLDSGKRYYETVLLTNPVIPENPITYESKLGDRWDLLASKFYGNSRLWYKLANANNGANGSIFIPPGTIIVIPEV